jgi:hypothetical protein
MYHHTTSRTGRYLLLMVLVATLCTTSAYHAQAQQPTTTGTVRFVSRPITEAQVGQNYRYDVRVEQSVPTLAPPTFSLVSAPEGMRIDATRGTVTWQPTRPGTFRVSIGAWLGRNPSPNARPDAVQDYELRVSQPQQPQPSVRFVSNPPNEVFAGIELRYNAQAVYADPRPSPLPPVRDSSQARRVAISYTLVRAPQGMTIDPISGTVRWLPTLTGSTAATVEVSIRAIAAVQEGSSTSTVNADQTFRLRVNPLEAARVFILTQAPSTAVTGREYLYQPFTVVARTLPNPVPNFPIPIPPPDDRGGVLVPSNLFGGNRDVVFSLVSAPQGMEINATTGLVRWRPDVSTPASTVSVTIRAALATSSTVTTTQTFSIRLTPREQVAVRFTSNPAREATVGREYRYDARAFYDLSLFGVNLLPNALLQQNLLTYALVDAPQGMTVVTSTGTVRWTPTTTGSTTVATVNVSIRAVVTTNNTLSSTQTFTLRVTAPLPPPPPVLRFVSNPPQTGLTGREFFYNAEVALVQTRPTFPPQMLPSVQEIARFSLVTAPQGMTIDSLTGIVRWTPLVGGDVRVVIRARLVGQPATLPTTATTAQQEFTVRVAQGPCAVMRGQVRFNDGSIVLSGFVRLVSSTSATNLRSQEFNAPIREGSYAMTLPSGDYAVSVLGEDFLPPVLPTVLQPVRCGDTVSRNFVVERRPPLRFFIVTGRVTRRSNGEPVPATVDFTPVVPQNQSGVLPPRPTIVRTDTSGNYRVVLDDRYPYIAFANPLARSGPVNGIFFNGTPNGTSNRDSALRITLIADRNDINFALPDRGTVAANANSAQPRSEAGQNNAAGQNTEAPQNTEAARNTSGQHMARAARLMVAPNPAESFTTINLPAFKGTARLVVMNIHGQMILDTTVESVRGIYELSTGTLPPGAYTVRLVGENVNASAQILVAH